MRSGGADGCDLAFEVGCDSVNGAKEIYLAQEQREMSPWAQERKIAPRRDGRTTKILGEAFTIMRHYHPMPEMLGWYSERLMARNSHQVLGHDLMSPVDFVVCYTVDGKMAGGTSQALRIAIDRRIEIFNIAIPGDIDRLNTWVRSRLTDPLGLPELNITDDM